MTTYKSIVNFDDTAEVTIKGKIGGREVEYTGCIKKFDVRIDDGIQDRRPDMYSWKAVTWVREKTTYSFDFTTVDGKAITAKIGSKQVNRTARVHYGPPRLDLTEVRMCRLGVGAPDGAEYEIDFENKTITFSWTEELA